MCFLDIVELKDCLKKEKKEKIGKITCFVWILIKLMDFSVEVYHFFSSLIQNNDFSSYSVFVSD